MTRPVRILLFILLWIILLGGGFVVFWIRDANVLKPELERIIEARTGVPVSIEGALQWQWRPSVSVTATGLRAAYQGHDWTIARIRLQIDTGTLLRSLGRRGAEGFALSGPVTFAPHAAGATTPDTAVAGQCEVELTSTQPAHDPVPATPDDLVAVALFHDFDWQADCTIDALTYRGQRFSEVQARLSNADAHSSNQFHAADFFGGSATLDLSIDAAAQPLQWTLIPALTDVDTRQLADWLDQANPEVARHWPARLAYGGTARFEGNTRASALASLSGASEFDGGTGEIGIAAIKQQMQSMARLLNEEDRLASWPDIWAYERLSGRWEIDRQRHDLAFTLDNLAVAARGTYAPDRQQLDIRAELTFFDDPELPGFDVIPALHGLAIPIRCRGAIDEPACRLDSKRAQRLVLQVLRNDDSGALRQNLDAKINQEVPEQYRDAARALLDLLSGGRQQAPHGG